MMNHAFCFHLSISANRNFFVYVKVIQDIMSRLLYKIPLYILWYETGKLPSLTAVDLLSCIILYATLTGLVLLLVDKEKAIVNLLWNLCFDNYFYCHYNRKFKIFLKEKRNHLTIQKSLYIKWDKNDFS